MASFTDSPQTYFSQASPIADLGLYGQTLDYKQAQYNQGVQRVQGAIDQVAGLDIMKPIAKDYLQSKMADLATQVNQVAGGDFSKQSMVMQTMSLASKAARDPTIQTAVTSTQQIRALSASQKKLYESHPELYPDSARWTDNQAVNDYLGSKDLEHGYGGSTEATRYTQHLNDVEKLVKQIVPDVKMERGADGRYQWNTSKYTTVTNDRIHQVINGYYASNPEATKSATMDALYTYRNHSASDIARAMNDTYTSNSKSLSEINERYGREILLNPTADVIADRSAAMAQNKQAIEEMSNNYQRYMSYLGDPSKLNDVKRSLYMDNVKGTYSTTFQKNEIERKIEENFNNKNIDEFNYKKAGLDIQRRTLDISTMKEKSELVGKGFLPWVDKQGNPIAIPEDSPYYAIYQAGLKGKGKNGSSKNDGNGVSDYLFGGPQVPGSALVAEKYGSTALLDKQAKTLSDAISNNGGTGVEDQFFSKWYSKNQDKMPDRIQAHGAFKEMLDKQRKLLEDGTGEPTAEFMEYWKQASSYYRRAGAFKELKSKADDYAAKMHPISAEDNGYSDALTAINQGLYNKGMVLHYGRESSAGNETFKRHPFGTLKEDSDPDALWGRGSMSPDEASYRRRRGALAAEVEKYKGTPLYNKLRALSDKGEAAFMNASGGAQSAASAVNEARNKSSDEYLKQNEKDFAPVKTIMDNKDGSDEYKTAQKMVMDLLTDKKGVGALNTYDTKGVDLKDLQIIAVQPEADGKLTYKFKVEGHKEDYITSTDADSKGIVKVDPDAELKQVIHVNGMTPATGDGVLFTMAGKGKIRYAIGESTYDKNQYDAYVIVNGHPVEIRNINSAGEIFHGASPSQIQKSIEAIASQMSRSNPSVPISREEAVDKLTMAQHEYEAKYPKTASNAVATNR